MRLDVALRELERAHAAMGAAVRGFTPQIGPIIYHQKDGIARFEVTKRDANSIEVLMAARIASGLNAARALLERGFAWEIAVLLRTVEDSRLTISFLEDGLDSPKPNGSCDRFVQGYFTQEILSAEEWVEDSTKKRYLPARKKRAADVRLMEKFADANRIRRMLEVEEEMLSGYVHGLYRQNMEMYRGAMHASAEGFVVGGAPNSPRATVMAKQIAIYTYRCLINFIAVAKRLELQGLAEELYREWKRFEASEAYAR